MTNELAIRIITGDVLGTSEQTQEAITMAVKALSMPSSQSEQKTGKWIKKKSMIYCPNCYNGFEAIFIRDYNFCPNCGAEMREVIEE